MLFKRYNLVIIVSLFPILVYGQDRWNFTNNSYLEANYGYGAIMPHHSSIKYLLEDHIKTVDIKYVKSSTGEKYWNQLFRYPDFGLGFYRSNLGNNDVYGYANAIYGFTKIPVARSANGSGISYQIAVGASYITDCFDINENYSNLAIGTHINIYIDFSLHSYIALSPKIGLTNNIRFTHFSNGNIQNPNYGLNIISGSIGLAYHFNSNYLEKKAMELPKVDSKNEYRITFSGGAKSINHYVEGTYFASSLIFDYNRVYSLKGKWGVGTDIFFDATYRQESANTNKNDIVNTDLYQVGAHVMHDFVMNRLAFTVQLGAYLYAPIEPEAPFYSRIGLRYKVNRNWYASMTLKSHYAIASFIEWGIGYSIWD